MRTHFLLEPAENPGSGEKLFKIYEEWYGHEHMNESNTKPSVLVTSTLKKVTLKLNNQKRLKNVVKN